jgi:glutamate racemase
MRPDSHSPIGVFDSGVGGLTVLKALMSQLPGESTLYLGDTARVPYGTKSGEVVTRYSLKNAAFLMERGIKLLVVACNTASAVALPSLAAALPVPVVGVIAPGARAALRRTRGGQVGVIGTPGTIRSGAYQRELESAAGPAGVRVKARACPLLVPLAEEGWLTGEVPRLVVREYLGDFVQGGVDTLVLGCTHYPLLKDIIAQVVGPQVVLVDSAEATAEVVAGLLTERGLLAPAGRACSHHCFVTDVPERFVEVGERFLGRRIPSAEQVDLSF